MNKKSEKPEEMVSCAECGRAGKFLLRGHSITTWTKGGIGRGPKISVFVHAQGKSSPR